MTVPLTEFTLLVSAISNSSAQSCRGRSRRCRIDMVNIAKTDNAVLAEAFPDETIVAFSVEQGGVLHRLGRFLHPHRPVGERPAGRLIERTHHAKPLAQLGAR